MRTSSEFQNNPLPQVSIPFKRESPCGQKERHRNSLRRSVSIPFKRESPCGLHKQRFSTLYTFLFQFPSNGKALADLATMCVIFVAGCDVSIPFKRESPCGRRSDEQATFSISSFNSLQTGKPLRTREIKGSIKPGSVFPFPSNGKALADERHHTPSQ